MTWNLIQPIKDNKADFARLFPGAAYMGDVGDTSHQARVSDHNPDYSTSMGWVRAQDLGAGGEFHLALFARWYLDRLREGWFPEVQYIITRHPDNLGTGYYGLFDRRNVTGRGPWTQQVSSGHDHHIHTSYRKGFEYAHSGIVKAWRDHLDSVKGDDDMPFGLQLDMHGLKVGERKEFTIAPVNTGNLGFGTAWMSLGCDGGDAKVRVVYQLDGENFWRPWRYASWSEGSVQVVKSSDPRNAVSDYLPNGCGKLAFELVEVVAPDPMKFSLSGFIEYGRK